MTDHTRSRSLRLGRFLRLPRREQETWQGGAVPLPLFSEDPKTGQPVRQAAIGWANLATGDVHLASADLSALSDHERVVESLFDFAFRSRKTREGRPSRIEVADSGLATHIRSVIGEDAAEVVVVSALPAIDAQIEGVIESEEDGVVAPGALQAAGMTRERLQAFADAARALFLSPVWGVIGTEDLVMVEAPAPPAGMGGFALFPDDRAIRFFESEAEYEALYGTSEHEDAFEEDADAEPEEDEEDPEADDRPWRLEFVSLPELPVRDVTPWADGGLPVAGDEAYPVVVRKVDEGTFERPDALRLAFVEGLLRALAGSSEEEIDSGRWTREVPTSDGPCTFRLALPGLLNVDEAEEAAAGRLSRLAAEAEIASADEAAARLAELAEDSAELEPPKTPEAQAQALVYRAMLSTGRRRTQLLRGAVRLWPDCYDALLLLAEDATPDAAETAFRTGLAAAERVIGADVLAAARGRFWSRRDTRTYLRLRFGLAVALMSAGRAGEAAAEFRDLLALDAADNAGARDYLLALLLSAGKDDEIGRLLEQFEDGAAAWWYGSALWFYRRGDRKMAAKVLRRAFAQNPLAAHYLVSDLLGPERADALGVRRHWPHDAEDEAEDAVDLLGEAWAATPGAPQWMLQELKRRK